MTSKISLSGVNQQHLTMYKNNSVLLYQKEFPIRNLLQIDNKFRIVAAKRESNVHCFKYLNLSHLYGSFPFFSKNSIHQIINPLSMKE